MILGFSANKRMIFSSKFDIPPGAAGQRPMQPLKA
jgi:hypothetical protein